MKLRERVETYWSVWIYNDHKLAGFWEPYNEGLSSRAAAVKDMREEQERHGEAKFAIVKTVNTRLRTAQPVTGEKKR